MSQTLLIFDVSSRFGFFLNNLTTTSGLTHNVIPRSTVEGLVGAILGLQSNEYPEKLGESKIAVQINGKTRVILELKKGMLKEEVKKIAIKDDKIIKYIQNKNIKKVIFVPEKIINIVI